MSPDHYDCLIIGGGAAGVSCALELIDSRRSHIIIEEKEELGGQLDDVLNTIRNFAGGFFENGQALKKSMLEVANRMGVNAILGNGQAEIDLQNKTVRCQDGRKLTGHTVVICTGTSPRKLNVELDQTCKERLIYVTEHLPPDDLKDRTVAVVGGGDSALIEAILAANMSARVYLLHRGDSFSRARGDLIQDINRHPNIEILLETIAWRYFTENGICKLSTTNLITGAERIIEAERVIAKLGWGPNSDRFKDDLKLDKSGYITVDTRCRTSMAGIFAAGDVTQPGRLAAAIGQGSIAAQQIHADLMRGQLDEVK